MIRRSPIPKLNEMARALDLFRDGEGFMVEERLTVVWEEGERVTSERINRAGEALKKATEIAGFECFEVEPILSSILDSA